MSQKAAQNPAPPKIILDDSFYQILANRRAARNAELAAKGLPPLEDNSLLMSESQARAEAQARASHNAGDQPEKFGPLSAAARAKLRTRRNTIPDFDRHSRKCQLCHHPDVDVIEEAFLNWHSARTIAGRFHLTRIDSIYRHARAVGLDTLRRQNVRTVVERFIEEADHVNITAASILRSIRALSCLDGKGRWTDLPSTRIIVTTKDLPAEAAAGSPTAASLPSDSAFNGNGTAGVRPPSSERSEPSGNVSAPGPTENGPAGVQFASFERSEPARASAKNSALPENAVSESVTSFERSEPKNHGSSLVTRHSSLPSRRSNRKNMNN